MQQRENTEMIKHHSCSNDLVFWYISFGASDPEGTFSENCPAHIGWAPATRFVWDDLPRCYDWLAGLEWGLTWFSFPEIWKWDAVPSDLCVEASDRNNKSFTERCVAPGYKEKLRKSKCKGRKLSPWSPKSRVIERVPSMVPEYFPVPG